MKIGVLSDTHQDKANMIPQGMDRFQQEGVEAIFHCGDIEPRHLDQALFGGLPVVCALTEEQAPLKEFCFSPPGWHFTKPGDRIVTLPNGLRFYIGHKRSYEYLAGSGQKLKQTMDGIRKNFDSVEWLFSGHTHHQIYRQDHLISFINPGAVENSFDGYEYAIVDTDTKEITFSRIPRTPPVRTAFSVGVISDSSNISDLDAGFWHDLARIFHQRQIVDIIHCGNIALRDIGREELRGFKVHCYLRADQRAPDDVPQNWDIVSNRRPVVTIEGYQFCIKHNLGATFIEKSEADMQSLSLRIRTDYPETGFVLFGSTHFAFLEEGPQVRIINPGDIVTGRTYAAITLPVTEIVFGNIPTR